MHNMWYPGSPVTTGTFYVRDEKYPANFVENFTSVWKSEEENATFVQGTCLEFIWQI